MAADVDAVGALASALATSFPFAPGAFRDGFRTVAGSPDARVLLAVDGADVIGYLLGFAHPAFYAGGEVAWVEEILVRADRRGQGAGRALMDACEAWAARRGCVLVALATRRAAPFYRALGYEESAAYLRKTLPAAGTRAAV